MEVSWVSAWRETYILLLYYSSDGSNPTTEEIEEKVRFKTFCADYTCKIERYRDCKRNCKWPSRANWTKFRINFLSIRSQFCTKLRIHSKKNLFLARNYTFCMILPMLNKVTVFAQNWAMFMKTKNWNFVQ